MNERRTGGVAVRDAVPPAASAHDVALWSRSGSHGANEDVVRVLHPVPGETLCLLADGLGGEGAGRLAATIAVDTIADALDGAPVVRGEVVERVHEANGAILAAQRSATSLARMRTTLVLLHLDARSAWWLHCGDSRLYHVRGGAVIARTVDHSVASMEPDDGGGTGVSCADRGALLRSLGDADAGASRPRTVRAPVPVEPGDRFLLCSDGFWERLDERALARDVADTSAGRPIPIGTSRWLRSLGEGLRSAGTGGRDDASAVAVGPIRSPSASARTIRR